MDKGRTYKKKKLELARGSCRDLQNPKTFQESEARGRRPQTKLLKERKHAVPFVCT